MIKGLVLTRYMAKRPADNSTLNSIFFTLSASWSFVIHATGLVWNSLEKIEANFVWNPLSFKKRHMTFVLYNEVET